MIEIAGGIILAYIVMAVFGAGFSIWGDVKLAQHREELEKKYPKAS